MPAQPLGVRSGVEREHQPNNQKVLRWRQAYHPWPHFTIVEEAPTFSPRIVIPVLQPQDRIGLSIRDAIFDRSRDGFDGLSG